MDKVLEKQSKNKTTGKSVNNKSKKPSKPDTSEKLSSAAPEKVTGTPVDEHEKMPQAIISLGGSKDGSSDEESDPECDLTGMNSGEEEEEEAAGEEDEFSEGEAEILERGAKLDVDDIPSDKEFDMDDISGKDDGSMEGSNDEVPELIRAPETKSKKSKPTESKPLRKP